MQTSMFSDLLHNEDHYPSTYSTIMEPSDFPHNEDHYPSTYSTIMEPLCTSGSSSMFCFEDVRRTGEIAGGSDIQQLIHGHYEDSEDDYAALKKRRLSMPQVQYLEKNFESERKLDPERKAQMAKEIGLHPKQVAIWFQNRRARLKNKQLEKDYISLKAAFDCLKNDHETLIRTRENLTSKVIFLREKLKWRKREFGESTIPEKMPSSSSLMMICSSRRGDGVNSDMSDVSTNRQMNALNELDAADFSDFCKEDGEDCGRNQSVLLPKLEHVDCNVFLNGSSTSQVDSFCNFGHFGEDQYHFWP